MMGRHELADEYICASDESKPVACNSSVSQNTRSYYHRPNSLHACRYALYKTRLGQTLHQRTCQECQENGPHSNTVSVALVPGTHVTVLPILADNYCFLIVDEATKTCLAVDPSGVHILPAHAFRVYILGSILCTSCKRLRMHSWPLVPQVSFHPWTC